MIKCLLCALSILLAGSVENCAATVHCWQSECDITQNVTRLNNDNTILSLEPGKRHMIHSFALVSGSSNISIQSSDDENETLATISCQKGVGLGFVNITNLTLRNIAIDGCGLSGDELEMTAVAIRKGVDMFLQVPFALSSALVIGDITNLIMHGVQVQNTLGLGMLGINLVGTASLRDILFYNNTCTMCTIGLLPQVLNGTYLEQIGGGMFLVYHDYHNTSRQHDFTNLEITNGSFRGNKDCSLTGDVAIRAHYSHALHSYGYTVGAGGGLSVVLSQVQYHVNVTVSSSDFDNNAAQYGAGAHILLFHGISNSSLTISGCEFANGSAPNDLDPDPLVTTVATGHGGGIAILGNIYRGPPYKKLHSVTNVSIYIKNTIFSGNKALIGGGMYTMLVQFSDTASVMSGFAVDHITVECNNCTFVSNTAPFGAAMYSYDQNVVTASEQNAPPRRIQAIDFHAANNFLQVPREPNVRNNEDSSGILDIRYLHFTLSGSSTLEHNTGTAIRARRSQLHISGEAVFHGNIGNYGGALSLIARSYLFITPNTSVKFTNNQARIRGGVFNVQFIDEPVVTYESCFLFLNSSSDFYCFNSSTCSDITALGTTLSFEGNKAPSGSIAYGSALNTCFWGNYLINQRKNTTSSNFSLWQFLANDEELSSIFKFDTDPVGINQVTTPSYKVELTHRATKLSAMPGEQFEVEMQVTDRISQIITAVVSSVVTSKRGHDHIQHASKSTVGTYNFFPVRGPTRVPITVNGAESEFINVTIYTIDSAAYTEIEVYLTKCALGFRYLNSNESCVCDPRLSENGVECSSSTHTLTVPSSYWLGPLSNTEQELVVHQCVHDYCTTEVKTLGVEEYDSQCAQGFHRTGLLCGLCEEGYSRVLGTNRCRNCNNNAHISLIVVFAAAGIMLIFVVAFLKVSIGEGYLNGVIFYSHILGPFIFQLAPLPGSSSVFLLVAVIDLDLGIETCFYNGMDALGYIGLKLVFPLYLYFLMGTIIILARFVKWPWNIGICAGKTFATLLILTHSSILRISIEVLSFVSITTISNPTHSSPRWRVDPSVHYFTGFHAFLVVVSVVFLVVYLIPLPLILLFPSRVYRCKYTRNLKPILDAFFAPYRPKFRCWIGIRVLLSILVAFVGLFPTVTSYNILVLVIIILLLLYVQALLPPYRGRSRNMSDTFFLLNAALVLLGLLFFRGQTSSEGLYKQTIFSVVLVTLAYVAFIGVLLYHIFLRLPTKTQKRIEKHIKGNKVAMKFLPHASEEEETVALESEDNVGNVYRQFTDKDQQEMSFESSQDKVLTGSTSWIDRPTGTEGFADSDTL